MASNASQPTTVEIIPSGELKGIEKAVAEVQDDLALLPDLKQKAEQLKVVWPDNVAYLEAGTLQVQVENIGGKDGKSRLKSYFDVANTVLNFLRNKAATIQAGKQEIINILSAKRNEWAKQEREATAKEQRDLDAKNKKAGAPKQEVLSNVPTTSGKRKTTTWPIEIRDADKFLKVWKKATGNQAKDLRQFILLDVQALGKEARDIQDPEAFMKRFPGIFNEKKESV